MSRILGIDYGDRHVGVAISDPNQTIASARETIVYQARVVLFEALEDIIAEEEIEEVVVGLPLSMSGEDTAQTERTRVFASQLEDEYGLTVHLEDERLTSLQAAGALRDDPSAHDLDVDAHAAQAILQGFLDRKMAHL
ncbi:MAG: Holliday junction resolvase RuvX [Candidatus Doudnabacteria bacterium]|nr:Holliday junction resolvase RuvX [Candidatus Doudnabacteria bacterium]